MGPAVLMAVLGHLAGARGRRQRMVSPLLLGLLCCCCSCWVPAIAPEPEQPRSLLAPSYMGPGAGFADVLALLTMAGLANRDTPSLWLNASAPSWSNGAPVNWPLPSADAHWLRYLEQTKGIGFDPAKDAALCTILADARVGQKVKGVIAYEPSSVLDALQYAAVSAGGLHDAIPATPAMMKKHACLAVLPVVLATPSASTFVDDLAVYQWMVTTLLPHSSTKVMVGVCKSWANYSCGRSDPLGAAAIDFAVASRGMVVNLSPNTATHLDQAKMFSLMVAHLDPLAAFSGWAELESAMVSLLSAKSGVVVCGAPNLSFLRAVKVAASKLPTHRTPSADKPAPLDPRKIYLTFMSNEGDTPKDAYSFRSGQWLSPARGEVPVSWGLEPIIAELVPGLWEYYVTTAGPSDQFFSATGGAGYAFPWVWSEPEVYFHKAAELNHDYMPEQNWVDMWESDCPAPKVPAPPPTPANRSGPAVHFNLKAGQWCGRSNACRKADGDKPIGGIQSCPRATQCEARCQALERCRSFNWQTERCYLWDCVASSAHAVTTPTTCGNCSNCPAGVAPIPPHKVDNPCMSMYERFHNASMQVLHGSIGVSRSDSATHLSVLATPTTC